MLQHNTKSLKSNPFASDWLITRLCWTFAPIEWRILNESTKWFEWIISYPSKDKKISTINAQVKWSQTTETKWNRIKNQRFAIISKKKHWLRFVFNVYFLWVSVFLRLCLRLRCVCVCVFMFSLRSRINGNMSFKSNIHGIWNRVSSFIAKESALKMARLMMMLSKTTSKKKRRIRERKERWRKAVSSKSSFPFSLANATEKKQQVAREKMKS